MVRSYFSPNSLNTAGFVCCIFTIVLLLLIPLVFVEYSRICSLHLRSFASSSISSINLLNAFLENSILRIALLIQAACHLSFLVWMKTQLDLNRANSELHSNKNWLCLIACIIPVLYLVIPFLLVNRKLFAKEQMQENCSATPNTKTTLLAWSVSWCTFQIIFFSLNSAYCSQSSFLSNIIVQNNVVVFFLLSQVFLGLSTIRLIALKSNS